MYPAFFNQKANLKIFFLLGLYIFLNILTFWRILNINFSSFKQSNITKRIKKTFEVCPNAVFYLNDIIVIFFENRHLFCECFGFDLFRINSARIKIK
jgi:hypothetical protein